MEHCDSNGVCVMPDSPVSSYHSTDNPYAELHRNESVQEKNVKEARTKCRSIASLLTDAPNPHSKGVLMFKKRRQRAKKYTLVSYGSVDEDRYIEDEDGVLPTSESEFDEEGFSDARSLTNNSDWDSTYMDIEKPKMEQEHPEEKGLSQASGKGAALFELQRQKSEQAAETIPAQTFHKTPIAPPRKSMVNGNVNHQVNLERSQQAQGLENVKVTSAQISLAPAPTLVPQTGNAQSPVPGTDIFNRSARPFTPGQVGQRSAASSVMFNPMPSKKPESAPAQNTAPPLFHPMPSKKPESAPAQNIAPPLFHPTPSKKPESAPAQNIAPPLFHPMPSKKTESAPVQNIAPPFTPFTPDVSISSQKTPVSSVASLYIPAAGTPRTTTASIYLSSPSRPPGQPAITSQSNITANAPATPVAPAASQYNSPPTHTSSYLSPSVQSPESAREQKISVPFGRSGILNEARKRGGKKQMFVKKEEKKYEPNPELLTMVQNLDYKPKQKQDGGFESGPEEDFLSLGAEACNFMQPSGRKNKVPPPVAPKPILKTPVEEFVNGCQDYPQLKGKGAELFAKRQSRMDKFVVDSEHRSQSRPSSRPRTPSPTPSLPSSWKYSSNIRAPPPIGYNPMVSPFYPLAATKSQGGRVESKAKKGVSGKPRMQAIDFMRYQPYQLNPAMFCSANSSSQDAQKTNFSVSPGRQVPVKTRAQEIKRFSTPTPMSSSVNMTPTVLTPRSATTLAEPVWRTDLSSQPANISGSAPYYSPVLESPYEKSYSAALLSPTSSVTSPRASVSRIQVPKPRFSAAKTGMQPNVWRPARVHF